MYMIQKVPQNRNAQIKAFKLSLSIVKVCRKLRIEHQEYDLSRQLMRSGTSIGANLEEVIGTQSRKETYHKIHLSYREARESRYWVKILQESNLIDAQDSRNLLTMINELIRILGAGISTMKRKLQERS